MYKKDLNNLPLPVSIHYHSRRLGSLSSPNVYLSIYLSIYPSIHPSIIYHQCQQAPGPSYGSLGRDGGQEQMMKGLVRELVWKKKEMGRLNSYPHHLFS